MAMAAPLKSQLGEGHAQPWALKCQRGVGVGGSGPSCTPRQLCDEAPLIQRRRNFCSSCRERVNFQGVSLCSTYFCFFLNPLRVAGRREMGVGRG